MALISRKRVCTRTSGDSETPIPETVLCSAMEELRQMRKERALQQELAAERISGDIATARRGASTSREDFTAKSFH